MVLLPLVTPGFLKDAHDLPAECCFFLPFLGDGKMSTRYEEALKVEPFFQSELGR